MGVGGWGSERTEPEHRRLSKVEESGGRGLWCKQGLCLVCPRPLWTWECATGFGRKGFGGGRSDGPHGLRVPGKSDTLYLLGTSPTDLSPPVNSYLNPDLL